MYRNHSLKRTLIVFIILCWTIPVLIIAIFLSSSYKHTIVTKIERVMENDLKNTLMLYSYRLDGLIDSSKDVSYDMVIENAWKSYKNDQITQAGFYRIVKGELGTKFYSDKRVTGAVFYLSENNGINYFSSSNGIHFLERYQQWVSPVAQSITLLDSSETYIKIIQDRLYIIRNMYTTSQYTKLGTLVLEVDPERLFRGISSMETYETKVYIDDAFLSVRDDEVEDVVIPSKEEKEEEPIWKSLLTEYQIHQDKSMISAYDKKYEGYLYQERFKGYYLGVGVVANKDLLYSELQHITNLVWWMFFILIPVLMFVLYYLTHHITKPMKKLLEAVHSMEQGNIGIQIESHKMPNTEFDYLMKSFNTMSSEVKELFDYACNERIARRDAKIMALQSQINPHFLNNTLEMMNWQARMAGDFNVSHMIEALGTLLDYTMGRSSKKLISLADELRCSDAYLYITSMRFGNRVHVIKNIDEDLLQMKVPQLILQPILENAIKHGIEKVKEGTVWLSIYEKNHYVVIEVKNTGQSFTEEDRQRIQGILSGTNRSDEVVQQGGHVSLGIYNVNERIRLIYGEEYSLTIDEEEPGIIVARMTLPFEPKNYEEAIKMMELLHKDNK